MTLTTHGHHIPGSETHDELENHRTVQCGGPRYCGRCSDDILNFEVKRDSKQVG